MVLFMVSAISLKFKSDFRIIPLKIYSDFILWIHYELFLCSDINLEHKVVKTSNGLQITGLGFGSYEKGPLMMSGISHRITLVVRICSNPFKVMGFDGLQTHLKYVASTTDKSI